MLITTMMKLPCGMSSLDLQSRKEDSPQASHTLLPLVTTNHTQFHTLSSATPQEPYSQEYQQLNKPAGHRCN